jgi:hypothetical protein
MVLDSPDFLTALQVRGKFQEISTAGFVGWCLKLEEVSTTQKGNANVVIF